MALNVPPEDCLDAKYNVIFEGKELGYIWCDYEDSRLQNVRAETHNGKVRLSTPDWSSIRRSIGAAYDVPPAEIRAVFSGEFRDPA